MKKILLLSLTILTLFTVKGQYRLDISMGYDYPKFHDFEQTGHYSFLNSKVYGIQYRIGLERNFNEHFSHSYGVSYLNRIFQNTTIKNTQFNNDTIINETKNSIGSLSLYYLTKFYIDKKLRLSLNVGIAYEHQQFRKFIYGTSKTFESNDNFLYGSDFIGTFGLTYEHPVSKNVNLYAQTTVSRSLVIWDQSQFNPLTGYYRGLVDYRINIGMTYDLQDKILTPKARMNRYKSDLIKTTYIRNVELRALAIFGTRKIKQLDDDYSDYVYNEYSTYNIQLNKNAFYGFGIGVSYSKNRFYAVLDATWEHYNFDIVSFKNTSYSYGHGPPQGYIENYKNETDILKFNNDRLGFIGGIGVKIFHPNSKVNVIPIIKLAYGQTIHLSIESNYHSIHYKYEWHNSPIPTANSEWDSTYFPSRLNITKKKFDILVGSQLSVSITNRLRINLELLYSLSKSPIVQINNQTFIEKLSIYSTLGIGYVLPLKDKPKPTNLQNRMADRARFKTKQKESSITKKT